MGFGSIQVKFLKPIKGKKDIYYHSGFDKFYKASQGD